MLESGIARCNVCVGQLRVASEGCPTFLVWFCSELKVAYRKGCVASLSAEKIRIAKAKFWDTFEQQHDNEMSKRCITRVGSHDYSCKASFVGHACAL